MSEIKTGVLTDEQVGSFHEKGYLIADFGLDHAMLDAIVAKVHPHFDEEFHKNPALPARVQDAWKIIDEVRCLATNAAVCGALEQLMERKALPFQTLNFPIGTRQSPHSDTIHFNTQPSGFMAGVWVALQDINMDNGPLIYYPGSHKLPIYSMQDLGLDVGYQYYSQYEECMKRVVADNQLQPEYGIIRKGEALIWHANLLHGGAPQNDLSQSRHSQVTHYFFEGCKYYTPMHSTDGKLSYRYPEWIPAQAGQKPRRNLLRRIMNRLGVH